MLEVLSNWNEWRVTKGELTVVRDCYTKMLMDITFFSIWVCLFKSLSDVLPNILMIKSVSQTQKMLEAADDHAKSPRYQTPRHRVDTWHGLLLVSAGRTLEVATPRICKVGWNLRTKQSRAETQPAKIQMWFLLISCITSVDYSVSLSQLENRVLFIFVFTRLCKSPCIVPVTVLSLEIKWIR